MKAKVTLTLEGVIELPEVWGEGEKALEIAKFHYDENTDAEQAIMDIVRCLKENDPDLDEAIINVSFAETGKGNHKPREENWRKHGVYDHIGLIVSQHEDYLDLLAESLGLVREFNEDDDQLRERCRKSLCDIMDADPNTPDPNDTLHMGL